MKLELERYRLEKLPAIVAEMMKPAEKIEGIRIHQISGLGVAPGGSGGPADGGARSPVNQVLDSILGVALQLPALKSIGESIGYDFSSVLPAKKKPGESDEQS
jgi:uncharacterized membrane protein YqiK